ncbi:putative CheA signal transduction histidine kinase [Solidesulfovibrio fructosivorans JJ]]|uniref:histidine kinase n=1 Tax=Solidesulfovibrio fructosivorans JJ] TaxID=596151 RepID=E1JTZ7_SOLFR|nr:transporter substrate-binding domain-containing protein [Solidesulfovibrio fructosivorans]EFL52276.1 putative CheA signal transduction histidine kinase [Solidesulfovibrio fructosivorans JJ]]
MHMIHEGLGGRRLALWLLVWALILFSGQSAARAATSALELTDAEKAFIEAHPVIRYSDTDWRPLSIFEDGRQEGLFRDYYRLISQKTGLAFQFETIGDGRDFQQVLDALREKRIDMIDGTGKTPDRASYALFVGPFLRFPLAVMSRDDATAYSLESLAGKKVAVGRGGTADEYLRAHGKNLELIPAHDQSEALTLVALGKADAAVENLAVAAYAIRASGLSNVKISGKLDYNFEIYTLVRKDWPLLASILEKAQRLVTEKEKAALIAKWLPVYKSGAGGSGSGSEAPGAPGDKASVAMTDQERAYLERKKALRFCVDPDWPPVERIDENGRYVGIGADFLHLMEKRLGVPMVLVPTASWSQSLAAVKQRRCDFLPAAGDTNNRRRFLRFTSPYLRFPMVVVTQAKAPFIEDPASLTGKSLGVVNGYASLDILRAKYPGLRLMEVPSLNEGLRLVADGRLYGCIDTVPAISQAIAKGHFTDLKIAGRLDAHLDLAVASRDDEPELASLFQKAVNTLTKEETDAIMKKWLAVTFEQGFDYSLVWKVSAGAAFIVVVVVWWNRKLSRLNRALRQANEARDAAGRRVAALLDNAGQGFLSVGADGLVEPQYSAECRNIFGGDGGDIEGKPVAELIFPDDPAGRANMAVNVRRVVAETDAYKRDLYVSLMPGRVERNGASLRLAYRPMADGRLMFVITDVTGEVRLKDAVARERNRLACVVAAVREQRDFFAVLDDFAAFRRDGFSGAGLSDRGALDALYRKVHTFKGLFLQLECAHVAKALDDLEERLSDLRVAEAPRRADMEALLADDAVDKALARDLSVVRETLGAEFFERRGEVRLGSEFADALATLAGRLLDRLDTLELDSEAEQVLRAARTLRYIDLKELLSAYPRTAGRLAESRGKSIEPFAVTGDTVLVDPKRFAPVAKSLIHVIRNAVDHGIESPAVREAAGKAPTGRLSCRVAADDAAIRIEFEDDGCGVDIAAIRARAYELGLVGAEELAAMDDAAILTLLFRDGFTSRRVAGELSGRGVGLAAVRAEAERLGGTVALINHPGRGTRLVVTLPRESRTSREDSL